MTSELERLREVMNRLRSPGGCPWDAEQTHASLLKYLLEESYEFVDAVESDDREGMREELGDMLLQVYFHARIAEEDGESPFDVEAIAGDVADKLIRRHPHVFGDVVAETSEDVMKTWESQKMAEKGRTSALDGVPLSQPAMPLANKLMYRTDKFGYSIPVNRPVTLSDSTTEEELGQILLGIIDQAHRLEIDPEAALRRATRGFIDQIKDFERKAGPANG
jgi:XTP/dITP diphosphohydrolase